MTTPLPHRAIAMLRAVAAGRAELTDSREPDLRVDGLPCCDQAMAHDLVHAGLMTSAGTGGTWRPATLTPLGQRSLAAGQRSLAAGEKTLADAGPPPADPADRAAAA